MRRNMCSRKSMWNLSRICIDRRIRDAVSLISVGGGNKLLELSMMIVSQAESGSTGAMEMVTEVVSDRKSKSWGVDV